jgi:hypothetical protein
MATAQSSLFEPAALPAPPLQRWWRLQGLARRAGRRVEPLLVTPRFLARIDNPVCPVQRVPLAPRARQVVALRADATVAAGHLVTLGPVAAPMAGGPWQDAWAEAERLAAEGGDARAAGLDAAAWRRLAVLRSFVQAPTPAEAACLPLLALPPNRLRVLSPVQGLQVAMTLALLDGDRVSRLNRLVAGAADEDTRLALRLCTLTLLARRPVGLGADLGIASRQALEDLWADPLLQRRWHRLAARLTDPAADRLLAGLHTTGGAGRGWRPLDAQVAVEGWDTDLRPARPARRVRRSESGHEIAAPVAAPGLAGPVLAPVRRRQRADADAPAAVVA